MDEVVAFTSGSGASTSRYYVHSNHLYSVAALTNAAGQVVERYSYTAYGKQTITSATGAVRAKSAVGWDRGFTSYVADNETGLLYARNRMYSPTLGRFISRNMFKQLIGPKYSVDLADPMAVMLLNNIQVLVAGTYADGYSAYVAAFAMKQTLDPSGEPTLGEIIDWIISRLRDPNFWRDRAGSAAMSQIISTATRCESCPTPEDARRRLLSDMTGSGAWNALMGNPQSNINWSVQVYTVEPRGSGDRQECVVAGALSWSF